ncbi:MAG: hypothetical protein R6U98_01260, partial [Pirellulaceae bacterium]
GFFRLESCPTQAVLPLVGLAAEKVIRNRYIALSIHPHAEREVACRATARRLVPKTLDHTLVVTAVVFGLV